MSTVKPIPDEYQGVTPYLIVKGAAQAIEFYQQAFGAREVMRIPAPGGKVGHAEIRIGNWPVMLADEFPEMDCLGPSESQRSPVILHFFTEDVDALMAQAEKAGGTITRAVADQFYGDRSGMLKDPFGHVWNIATHKEDLSPEEIAERMHGGAKG